MRGLDESLWADIGSELAWLENAKSMEQVPEVIMVSLSPKCMLFISLERLDSGIETSRARPMYCAAVETW